MCSFECACEKERKIGWSKPGVACLLLNDVIVAKTFPPCSCRPLGHLVGLVRRVSRAVKHAATSLRLSPQALACVGPLPIGAFACTKCTSHGHVVHHMGLACFFLAQRTRPARSIFVDSSPGHGTRKTTRHQQESRTKQKQQNRV